MKSIIRYDAFDKGDIVLLPFPFTNLKTTKRRPGLVISPKVFNKSGDTTILFMTSNVATLPREGDVLIQKFKDAGLPKPTLVRMKFVTIANALILKKIGRLPATDMKRVKAQIMRFFGMAD
ncbi:MAG: type II toxin-antitoxin system PemK/MazF family toxin [Spirochaetes bacterium]|nr:type II toxin-antitoxin system PemK/MazF family toxin [Spirochaetota bacterium]MBX3722092.1 type II toxin-antitoxin system PemK/MazF family toxin [Turneriella sp.]